MAAFRLAPHEKRSISPLSVAFLFTILVLLAYVEDASASDKRQGRDSYSHHAATCGCSEDEDWQCGTDGVSYMNPCVLSCKQKYKQGLSIANRGRCHPKARNYESTKSDQKTPPFCACFPEILYRCGSDGLTYYNLCLLECAQEVNPSLTVVSEDVCQGDSLDY